MDVLQSLFDTYNDTEHVRFYDGYDETCIDYRGIVIKFYVDVPMGLIHGYSVNLKKADITVKCRSMSDIPTIVKQVIDLYYNLFETKSDQYKPEDYLKSGYSVTSPDYTILFK